MSELLEYLDACFPPATLTGVSDEDIYKNLKLAGKRELIDWMRRKLDQNYEDSG